MRECKMIRLPNGRLVPVLPTGETIPGIARDSIQYIQDDERFKRAGLVRVRLDLLIWEKDIEGGYPLTLEKEDPKHENLVSQHNFASIIEMANSLSGSIYDLIQSSTKRKEADSLAGDAKSCFLRIMNSRRLGGKPLLIDKVAFDMITNIIAYIDFKPEFDGQLFVAPITIK